MAQNYNVLSTGITGTATKAKSTRTQLYGIYHATVMDNNDATRSGILHVHVPFIHRDPTIKNTIPAQWSSPYAGVTNINRIDSDNIESYDTAQQSYGMWTPAPDVGNVVLIAFADGNIDTAYVISKLLPPGTNYMMPGIPAGTSYQASGFNVPVAEKNKYSGDPNLTDTLRPIHHDLAEAITLQGLINDPVRGTSKSGARRETASEVFGILSRGLRDPEDSGKIIGAGHQFIMDDNYESRNIRIRTGGGSQILLDDTNGVIYMINKDGTAWAELDKLGNINLYGEGNLNLRARGDFNLRADKNVNIEAGNDVKITARGDNDTGGYKGLGALGAIGLPPLGVGGNIRLDAAADASMHASLNAQVTANGGDLDLSAGGRVAITASGPAPVIGGIQLLSQGQIAMKSNLGASIVDAVGVTFVAPFHTHRGALILLNSGGLMPGIALPAVPAPQISTASVKDYKKGKPPKYQRPESGTGGVLSGVAGDALGATSSTVAKAAGAIDSLGGNSSEAVLPEGGKRTEEYNLKTAVSTLLTAEPYAGHATFDIQTEDPSSLEEDTSADAEANDTGMGLTDTPEGTKVSDPNALGNAVNDATNSVTSAVNSATGAVNDAVSSVTGAVNNAVNNVENQAKNAIKGALGGVDNLLPAQISDFKNAAEQQLKALLNTSAITDAIKQAIPPIRFPTANALQQKIIGSIKQIKDIEAQISQFTTDLANLPADMMNQATSAFNNKVNALGNEAANAFKAKNGGSTEASGSSSSSGGTTESGSAGG